MAFSNVNLTYQNVSEGPVSGRYYSIDHVNQIMLAKTFAGSLVASYPLDTSIPSEVLELEYDGYYFWALNLLGGGTLGVAITKWFLNGSILQKQVGEGNEINLVNNFYTETYSSEAFCVHRYSSYLTTNALVGDSQVQISDLTYLSIGDSIYFGPSSHTVGAVLERKITNIIGNIAYLDSPLTARFNTNDKIIYRKDIWVFNNYDGMNLSGSLVRINSNNGYVLGRYSGGEYNHITAATVYNGNLIFARGTQLIQLKVLGTGTGFVSSYLLTNTKNDNNTVIKVCDLIVDSTSIYKLQKEQHIFNAVTYLFDDTVGSNNNYHLDTEFFASRVNSITTKRDRSIVFGVLDHTDFTIIVTDQYDLPLLGRSISIQENDSSGLIPVGYTSFTTDSQGIGITRYSTGATPNFFVPQITAIDLGTQRRLNFNIEQLKNSNTTTTIDQRGKINTVTFLEQAKRAFKTFINQTGKVDSKVPLEQKQVKSKTYLEQVVKEGKLVLEQQAQKTMSTVLEQRGAIIDTVTVTQYNFLTLAIPRPYSKKNDTATNILVRIIGFGSIPLNASTLVFKVNGFDVTSSVVVTSFSGGLQLEYNPPVNFEYNSVVSIYISVQDTDSPPRTVYTAYTFDIVDDYKSPVIYEVYPADNSSNNLPLTEVYARIKDLETGIDTSSIEMFVAGKSVPTTVSIPQEGHVKVVYTPTYPLPYSSEVYAQVKVKDTRGNESLLGWNFTIQNSAGVLFTNMNPEQCYPLVPIDSSICTEVFGLKDGINIKTFEALVQDKPVTFVLKSKVYRAE